MSNIKFDNIGFYQTKLTNDQLEPVKKEITEIQSKFNQPLPVTMNAHLAGNIAREYELLESKSYLNSILNPHINLYLKDNALLKCSAEKLLTLDRTWVNFQSKHEFNPVHIHSGLLSFVIWINIPYNIVDEMNNNSVKYSNLPVAGTFSFLYIDAIGSITEHIIKADKSYENTFLLFPSKLSHCVYPFYTSNEYRISVSGNFKLL